MHGKGLAMNFASHSAFVCEKQHPPSKLYVVFLHKEDRSFLSSFFLHLAVLDTLRNIDLICIFF